MLIKVVIVIVILACLGPFFINGPDGQPLLTLDDVMPSTPDVRAAMPAEPVTVYKWQDENGIWQFSTEPVEGADTMELDGQLTVMDAIDPRDMQRLSGEGNVTPASFGVPDGLMSVSPDKVGEMMDTVNNLQQTVDDRKTEVDERIGGN